MTGMAADLKQWFESYLARVPGASETLGGLPETVLAWPQAARASLLASLEALARLAPGPDSVAALTGFAARRMEIELQDSELPEAARPLLQGLLRLREMEHTGADRGDGEGLRRLLLALTRDLRVVLIALAWRVAELRAGADMPPGEYARLGRQTLRIQAPLANRLGIWQLKWELEDLAFRATDPDTYHRIAKLVSERRDDRERFISEVIDRLQDVLDQESIQADVKGRPKHIYSIYRKMQRKGLDFHELYDVRAVRVLVDTVAQCYSVLGLVHGTWQPVPGEFDDYITNPKGNMYQSLHTAVSGPQGKVLEVQIRTHDMHAHAELGVAAHWRYKEGGPADPAFEQRVVAMRQLLDGMDREGGTGAGEDQLLDSFEALTAEERVYVLSPDGEVFDVPAGGTVLDFAYHVHTEVGHRCRGAKVNGRIVPLTHQVANGDRVEILTGKEAAPSRDWINPRLGYIKGSRARGKIRQWFRKRNYAEHREQGAELVEQEFQRLDLTLRDDEVAPLLKRFNFSSLDDLHAGVGAGDLTALQVANAVLRARPETTLVKTPVRQKQRASEDRAAGDVVIAGVGNLMTQIANCCKPIPGDQIGGFVTRGRGVSIHRADCVQWLELRQRHPDRILEVNWGGEPAGDYEASIRVWAHDRRELLKDLSSVLVSEQITCTAMDSRLDDDGDEIRIQMRVRINDYEQLAGLLARFQTIPNVRVVRRVS